MLSAIVVFTVMFALDIVWARYTMSASRERAIEASVWASLIIVLSSIVTISYVSNPWLILPAVAGAFVGTYVGIKYKKAAGS
jgi:uncharacterized membrane protein YhaH (DUF805 family)